MLLNLLSKSTPGGSRNETQSIQCLLYPNPFHRTTARKKGALKDYEENWPNIPNPLFEAWVTIVKIKAQVFLNDEQYSNQDSVSILKLQIVQKTFRNCFYARSLSPVHDAKTLLSRCSKDYWSFAQTCVPTTQPSHQLPTISLIRIAELHILIPWSLVMLLQKCYFV